MRIDIRLPVIFITATNDSDTAIEAMKMGAYDYLLKPLDIRAGAGRLVRACTGDAAADELAGAAARKRKSDSEWRRPRRPQPEDAGGLQADRPRRRPGCRRCLSAASGIGKELIARARYQHGHRNGQCFMAVNCTALTDTLLESELFGHEKGPSPAPISRHIGTLRAVQRRHDLLDEVGDMSPATQSKVLRLLQEQKFEARRRTRYDLRRRAADLGDES